ncbi:MAG: translation elongation factor Ts [Flammeovirgaceae bacterium]
MAAITAKMVNDLRAITGAGMMDCKNALVEADGDTEKAIDILRKKGQKIAAKRADKEAKEGRAYAFASGKEGVAFSFNCETEPVSNTEEFVKLGQKILDTAIKHKPATKEELVAIVVEGKPLSEQIIELSGRIGEKIEVSSYAFLKGEQVVSYLHGTKIAVLVSLSMADTELAEVGKNIGMQIAAMNPVAVDEKGVPAELVEREKQVGIEKARQEGKPEAMLEKIAEGFVKKFYKENTLLNQEYVKDAKLTIKQYLDNSKKGLTVSSFARISVAR